MGGRGTSYPLRLAGSKGLLTGGCRCSWLWFAISVRPLSLATPPSLSILSWRFPVRIKQSVVMQVMKLPSIILLLFLFLSSSALLQQQHPTASKVDDMKRMREAPAMPPITATAHTNTNSPDIQKRFAIAKVLVKGIWAPTIYTHIWRETSFPNAMPNKRLTYNINFYLNYFGLANMA